MSQLSQFKILSFKYSPKPSPPLLSVDSLLPALDPKVIRKHPNYRVFFKHIAEFFNTGRILDAGIPNIHHIPHFIPTDMWISSLSFVLTPEAFSSTHTYLEKKQPDICKQIVKLLFKILSKSSHRIYPPTHPHWHSQGTIPITPSTSLKAQIIGISHGPSIITPYGTSYLNVILKQVNGTTILFEEGINKPISTQRTPSKKFSSKLKVNQQSLHPITPDQNALHFNQADLWQGIIKAVYRDTSLTKLSDATPIPTKAPYSKKTDFKKIPPILYTWASLTPLLIEFEQHPISSAQLFIPTDLLHITLMSIDMAIQVHTHLQNSPKDTRWSIMTGVTHQIQMETFLSNPSQIYLTLTQLFDRVNQDAKMLNKTAPFTYAKLDTPPKTSSEIATWVKTILIKH